MSDLSQDELTAILDGLNPESRVLLAEASLGEDAIEFFKSEVGQYIIGCAKQEIFDAQEKLKEVSPWRRNRISELQNQIWRSEKLLQWLRELVVNGVRATQALENGEE